MKEKLIKKRKASIKKNSARKLWIIWIIVGGLLLLINLFLYYGFKIYEWKFALAVLIGIYMLSIYPIITIIIVIIILLKGGIRSLKKKRFIKNKK
ncbi:MAG TPA: hypothetical protein VJH65_03915 [Candidatus Nanoarchaeia archaeon]|nr:hypothetical protein [Candidatus Nanoarchaeia archaeon]